MRRLEPFSPEESIDSPARQRIIAAARQQFFTHGFRGVTMDDLAQELGMSKKTLYLHFPGKSALLESLIHNKVGDIEADLDGITSTAHANFLDGLHQMLATVQRHSEEIKPPFLRDLQREAPHLFQVVEARRREVIPRYFGKLLEEGRREGLLRKDIPVPLIVEILLGAVQSIINPLKLSELGLTPKTGFTAIITVVLQGVLTDEARAQL